MDKILHDLRTLNYGNYGIFINRSKLVLSRVIIRVTPFRARITLLITYLLSPLPLPVGFRDAAVGFREIRITLLVGT